MGGNAYMAQSEINKTNCSLDILLLRMYSCTLKIFSTDQIRKHVLPQVNACHAKKKERKAPASAAAGNKAVRPLTM